MPCSLNRVRILSTNDVFWSRTFSMVCLILATCVWTFSDFVTVFLALPVVQYLGRLVYLYTTAFVDWYKLDHFLLPPAPWYLF